MTEELSLWALFAAAFLAPTILPGSSEAALLGVLAMHPSLFWPAIAVAWLGNTLGGTTSYLMGRLLPQRVPGFERPLVARALRYAHRYGSPTLLAAWVPVIGDPLCIAAGWLRLPWLPALAYMALGRFARYVVVALLAPTG